ncbi:MAG: YceI family protein, partial [Pseudomonadota bacterium]
HTPDVAAAELEAVQSDWTVQAGQIAITVTQLGSDVTGSFGDWTAAITYDETVTEGLAGTVEVTISIGSLTLGSVTGQALGADFFNAETFPTARYTADLIRTTEGHTADGTLTIKDQSVPVAFPFELQITDGIATVAADTTLDRRAYGIGDNQTDEASLGFTVDVAVSLTASQGG